MTLIERLLAQANKEANELADLLNEAAQALAQPQQAPKFLYDQEEGLLHDPCSDAPTGCIPLYTSPPARKPLTDEQWLSVGRQARDAFFGCKQDNVLSQIDCATHAAMRATESAHGIKETP